MTTHSEPAPVAVVTGAGRGIGRAIALRLARDGTDVALVDVRPDGIDCVAGEIEQMGRRGIAYVADVSVREQVREVFAHAERDFGGLDIVVNNAGVASVDPLDCVDDATVHKVFGVNVAGVLWGIQAGAESFRRSGRHGRIINASSIAGHEGYAMLGVYCASKFAVRALTQAAAKELAPHGITVNAYCPGVVGTDMWDEIDAAFAQRTGAELGETFQTFASGIALGRPETPEDVAGYVSYLAGPDASYMTGQSGLIDGGLVYR